MQAARDLPSAGLVSPPLSVSVACSENYRSDTGNARAPEGQTARAWKGGASQNWGCGAAVSEEGRSEEVTYETS